MFVVNRLGKFVFGRNKAWCQEQQHCQDFWECNQRIPITLVQLLCVLAWCGRRCDEGLSDQKQRADAQEDEFSVRGTKRGQSSESGSRF